jgi:hypothetical protein
VAQFLLGELLCRKTTSAVTPAGDVESVAVEQMEDSVSTEAATNPPKVEQAPVSRMEDVVVGDLPSILLKLLVLSFMSGSD